LSENNLHTKQTDISENKNIPVDALVMRFGGGL